MSIRTVPAPYARALSSSTSRIRRTAAGSASACCGAAPAISSSRSSAARRSAASRLHHRGGLEELDRLGGERRLAVDAVEVEQVGGEADEAVGLVQRGVGARLEPAARPVSPARRSSCMSSSVACSVASGVRSSCDAVATNAWRAASSPTSRARIVSSAPATSPTSSRRPTLTLCARPSLPSARASSRRRRSWRSRPRLRAGRAPARPRRRRRARAAARCGSRPTAACVSLSGLRRMRISRSPPGRSHAGLDDRRAVDDALADVGDPRQAQVGEARQAARGGRVAVDVGIGDRRSLRREQLDAPAGAPLQPGDERAGARRARLQRRRRAARGSRSGRCGRARAAR